MTRLTLALCSLVLAGVGTTSALADTVTFDFSFTSTKNISGSGSFTATSVGTDEYLIDSISGTTDTGDGTDRKITSLLAPGTFPEGAANDNLLFFTPSDDTYSLDVSGLSYELNNGALLNLFSVGTNDGVDLLRVNGNEVVQSIDISIAPESSPVPEPESMVLLGTGLLGMVGLVRRRLAL
ncbi:PEP-CTERM sorting domain-containing protein [Granulicella sp. L60]|jgi:hypothetical protein|uniref:PEP-CTERM sorting domain-containing protein n=1 Tax=Granulicella sp. L60 TaxID=1641866 RepID=UPI00131CEC8A|nr:PEP-CTERM sorting domain-containing protein [Granulicella sp. L60]